jgi:hypothetical protein
MCRIRAESFEYFGRSLTAGDFDGDGISDLAVGSDGEDVNPGTGNVVDAGAVNVFYGSATYGLQADSSRGREDQFFARTVNSVQGPLQTGAGWGSDITAANFGNGTPSDLAVGAFDEDVSTLTDAGAVSVLYGTTTQGLQAVSPDDQLWTQDSSFVRDESEAGDWFGRDLAAGKFNSDQWSDLAIGAWHEDVTDPITGIDYRDAGAVNALYGSSTGLQATSPDDQFWSQGNQVNGSFVEGTLAEFDFFGRALGAGDFDGNGDIDLAIGTWGEDFNAPTVTNSGAVNILYSNSSGLQAGSSPREDQLWYQGKMVGGGTLDDSPQTDDEFGKGLGAADFNGDSISDLAVGTWLQDISGNNDAGSVNVLYGTSSSGLQVFAPVDEFWYQGTLDPDGGHVLDGAEAGDRFGFFIR